jgi:hypothetical protein
VEEILKETGFDYQYLKLEITKRTVMKVRGDIVDTLSVFKKSVANDLGNHLQQQNHSNFCKGTQPLQRWK